VIGQQALVQDRSSATIISTESYDVLVLDGAYKQSLICARSLGRAGLRVAVGERREGANPSAKVAAFRSRYCARSLVLPDYVADVTAYTSAIIEFVREHPTRVIVPTGDATIAALAPMREQFAALGCVLALARDSPLAAANDKARTLQVAAELGIAAPRSIQIGSVDDLAAAIDELGFPFVLKPTISWTGKSRYRTVPTEIVNKAEAIEATNSFLQAGAGVIAQEWASGRREGATLFIAKGEVRAICGHVEHRTAPPLGGTSSVRESIQVPVDILDSAIRLAKAIDIEGPCEVEFRRDASGRPLLMEINPRLAGTLETTMLSGVNLPLMVWHWATGQQVEQVASHRTGVRTRWLQGDLRWLGENHQRIGRPDSVSLGRSLWLFFSEFARTRHYDVLDWRDMRPGLVELRSTAQVIVKAVQDRVAAKNHGSQEGNNVE
jgi:carbamoyl-phosphate synthase large subunit